MPPISSRWAKTRLGLMVIGLFLSLMLITACGEDATSPLPAGTSSPTTSTAISNRATPTVTRSTPQASTLAPSSELTLASSASSPVTATTSAAIPASSPNSPCSLVTKAEAEAILGEAVKDPGEQYGGCTYYLLTPKPGTLASIPWVTVTRTQGTRDNFNSAVKAYERAGPPNPQSGLGDYAVSVGGFLFILKGSNIISIQPGNTEIPVQQVRAFALKALGRV